MSRLELRVPPVVLTGVVAIAMWSLSFFGRRLVAAPAIRLAVAGMAVVAGASFIVGGVTAFRRARTTVSPVAPAEATALVVSGVYRLTRNPMYAGMAFLLLAWALYLATPSAFALVAVFIVYLTRFQIMPEERALVAVFGQRYIDYRNRVRRWL